MTDPSFIVHQVSMINERRVEWTMLAEASRNIFLSWEWLFCWWMVFGAKHELLLRLVCRHDGSPAAILPLYRDRRRPRALRMLGQTQSDLLGPICASRDRPLALRALRQVLDEEDADVFVGNALRVDQAWADGLGGQALTRMTSPTLDYRDQDWDGVQEGFSSHLRKRLRQVERRLGRHHEVDWTVAGADDAEKAFETMVGLHDARWGSASGAFRGAWGELHRLFVPFAAERGWLRLTSLNLDGAPVGALYNFRYGGYEWNYQSGRDPDPAYRKLELGMAMNARAIRDSIADGLQEYRFLRGPEAYKSRFANRDDPVETVVVPLRMRARPLVPLLRVSERLPTPARRRLRRLVD